MVKFSKQEYGVKNEDMGIMLNSLEHSQYYHILTSLSEHLVMTKFISKTC